MEWRRATWAALGVGLFVTGLVMGVTWIAASASAAHSIPWWPLLAFGVLALLGLAIFVIAMFKAQWLPDHRLGEWERQQERAERASEHRSRMWTNPLAHIFDPKLRAEEAHTRALEVNAQAMREHTAELQRQREDRPDEG